jgi:predicted  nucleic acid-binding Zn-ribbon protein
MHERLEAEARARVAREHVAASALSALQRETTKYKRHVKLSATVISDLRAALTAKEEEARNTKRALVQLQRQMAMLRATDMAAALAGMSLGQAQQRNGNGGDEDSDSDDGGSGTGVGGVMPGAEGGIPRWGTSR